jgi:hypothetical protein
MAANIKRISITITRFQLHTAANNELDTRTERT